MRTPINISAPGKLFLVGEYAVLDGAPALLTAVDRRAHVTLTPSTDKRWRVSAPNLGMYSLELGPDGRLPQPIDDDTRAALAVFDAVRATVAEHIDTPFKPLSVIIDSSDFARDGHKLGLGSSAAVAAALTQGLMMAAGRPPSPARLATIAIRAHRRAQHGSGSGGDVAASIHGGVISYRRERRPARLDWPPALVGLAVVTGTGARTADLVGHVRAYAARDPQGYAADMARLRALADDARQTLTCSDRFLQLAAAYFEALTVLDEHAQAGIVTPRHHELQALSARHNAVFKTSGAGGGDVGLAFVHRGADEHLLRATLADAGAHVVPLSFGAPGLRIEPAAECL